VIGTGECFCGGIKYKIAGKLRDPLACHCSRCRKAFSSQSSNYARIRPDDFDWVLGENLLTGYVGNHGFGLLFCSVCGSTLCGILDDEIHGVTLGCLNDEPDIEDIHHIFVASKARWDVLPFGATTFFEGREDSDRRD
jgi:hypothetical protein